MSVLRVLTNSFAEGSREIFGDNLTGVYLHGSAVMGCFNEKRSDVDLVVVVKDAVSKEVKFRYMDMVTKLNGQGPAKGIEMSVVRREVCKPFVYPTPFELHFSVAHSDWYKRDPADYIEKMNGTDKDLAAHFTVIYNRGECLCGEGIKEVFGPVRREFYFDSIWNDIANAEEEIVTNTAYMVLNLCRVLAYKREGLILSKKEGGEWGLGNVSEKYCPLISQALGEYLFDREMVSDKGYWRDFARFMIEQIKTDEHS